MKIAVIGAGIVGLATTKSLLERRQHEVRCYEAGEPMQGRSQGDARVFRISHQQPEMIELACKAKRAWDAWIGEAQAQLLGTEGMYFDIPDFVERQRTMSDLGAPAEIIENTSAFGSLTSHDILEPLLHDQWAGSIRAAETGRFLSARCDANIVRSAVESIEILESGATVRTADETWQCDSVVVAAGSNTSDLVATGGVDLNIPQALQSRFTFRMSNPNATAPFWLDAHEPTSVWGFSPQPGHWAMGAYLSQDLTQLDLGAETVADTTLKALQQHIENRLDRLDPEFIDVIDCTYDKLGDGIYAQRIGPVLAVWGDNLFKFAPVLGTAFAQAAVDLALPKLPLQN